MMAGHFKVRNGGTPTIPAVPISGLYAVKLKNRLRDYYNYFSPHLLKCLKLGLITDNQGFLLHKILDPSILGLLSGWVYYLWAY